MNTLAEVAPKALQRESLSKRAADSIRAAALNGEYQLDQKLREVELSKSYGVSNSVVREAFHILQGEAWSRPIPTADVQSSALASRKRESSF